MTFCFKRKSPTAAISFDFQYFAIIRHCRVIASFIKYLFLAGPHFGSIALPPTPDD